MSGQTADQNQRPDPKQVINSLLLQYKLSLQAGNRSPKTISWYFDILEQYFSFLEINNLLKPIEELGKQELKAYVLYLQAKTIRWEGHKHICRPKVACRLPPSRGTPGPSRHFSAGYTGMTVLK